MPPLALLRLPGSAGGPSGGAPPDAMAPGGRGGRAAGSHPEDRQGPECVNLLRQQQRGRRRLLVFAMNGCAEPWWPICATPDFLAVRILCSAVLCINL